MIQATHTVDSRENQKNRSDLVPCIHCGTLTLDSSPDSPESQVGPFCCGGCERVYALLHEMDLDQFYALRSSDSTEDAIPGQEKIPEFHYLDEETFRNDFVKPLSNELSEIAFFIEGIHCTACIWLLEKIPLLLDSVTSTRLDYSTSCLTVTFQSSRKLSEIARLIASLGYHPRPLREDEFQEAYKRESLQLLFRLGVAAVSAGNTMMIAVSLYEGGFSGIEERYLTFFTWFSAILALPVVLYSAQPFYRAALAGLRAGRTHVDLPITIGVIGGYLLSLYSTIRGSDAIYFDSISILVFLMLAARVIQRAALRRAADIRRSLEGFLPQSTTLVIGGEEREAYIESLSPGDTILVRKGETIPTDSRLVSEKALLDTSVMTGESHHVRASTGDLVYAGTVNVGGSVSLLVEKKPQDSRIQSFLNKRPQENSTKLRTSTKSIDTISQLFVTTVLCVSLATFFYWLTHLGLEEASEITLAFLVVTCPCALGLSAPLLLARTIAGGIARGVFIADPESIENSQRIHHVFLDKTGTLTLPGSAEFKIISVENSEHRAASTAELQEIVPILLGLEEEIDHPLAVALRNQFSSQYLAEPLKEKKRTRTAISGITENGVRVAIGSLRSFPDLKSLPDLTQNDEGGVLLFQKGDRYFLLLFREQIDPSASELVLTLQKNGQTIHILSGDGRGAVLAVAAQLGIPTSDVGYELSPEEKAEIVLRADKGTVMIGDGANDAPAFQVADVGIGIRGGAQQLLSATNVYIQSGKLTDVLLFFRAAKTTARTLHGCYLFALTYNLTTGCLAVCGYISPLLAAILMPVSSLTVIVIATLSKPFPKREN